MLGIFNISHRNPEPKSEFRCRNRNSDIDFEIEISENQYFDENKMIKFCGNFGFVESTKITSVETLLAGLWIGWIRNFAKFLIENYFRISQNLYFISRSFATVFREIKQYFKK
jgi:hypothetical protein